MLERPDARALVEATAAGDPAARQKIRSASPWLASAIDRAKASGQIREGEDPTPGLQSAVARKAAAVALRTPAEAEAR